MLFRSGTSFSTPKKDQMVGMSDLTAHAHVRVRKLTVEGPIIVHGCREIQGRPLKFQMHHLVLAA